MLGVPSGGRYGLRDAMPPPAAASVCGTDPPVDALFVLALSNGGITAPPGTEYRAMLKPFPVVRKSTIDQ